MSNAHFTAPTRPRLEDSHGEFFAAVLREHLPPDRRDDFSECIETMATVIETSSPAMFVPCAKRGMTIHYGLQVPVGTVGILLIDGATRDQDDKPSWLLAMAEYQGWSQRFRDKLFETAGAGGEQAIVASLLEQLREIHAATKRSSAPIKAARKEPDDLLIGRLIYSAMHLSPCPGHVEDIIKASGVPGVVLLVSLSGRIFASLLPIGVGMLPDLFEELQSEMQS